ncbi:ATP-binding protein [Stakelama saccharophila]|uniref:histidine kinase n=1 Tax=Stakelama saccharophila TaxID=3075605 RepID=A0ABZ0BCW0_9SPHN|nr:ATP-binding protein [Stakelama sp. W311]WNO55167.1 ATP-binding protein [Stakelama sp. W311]
MRRILHPSLGLIGRLVAILLITLVVEFVASTLLYEQASRFAVREDEARRLAEHLVISRKLVEEREPARRPAMAAELTTDRYAMHWDRLPPATAPIAPRLDHMREQVLAWESSLAREDLRLRLASPGGRSTLTGGLRLDDGSWLHFQTLHALEGLDLATERILLALIPAIALMIVGGMIIRRTLQPLGKLATAAERVGSGDQAPVAEEGPSEVVRVVRAFNRMQERIHRLIADRTRALAAVGHDFRTPLARLRLRAEGVADRETRDAIEADIAEMEAMVASLLAYLGGDDDPEQPVSADIAVLCATLIDDAQDHGRDAVYDGPDHLEMPVRVAALKRAVQNLVDNALRHGDRIVLRLAVADVVAITVEDDGPGIPEADLYRVVQPFVRLDSSRRRDTIGFGLGLAIVQRVARLEGGELTLENRAGGGLRATLRLPRR